MPVRNIQILATIVMVCVACYVQSERLKYGGKIGENLQLIEKNYVDELDSDELYHAAMQGIVSKLDRFSEFILPSQYEEFQSVIEQQFGGVGIMIEGPPTVKQLTVVTPIPGTPAFKAGIQPGDVITQIDSTSTEGLLATDATKLMRGPVGESVQLTVRRMGVPRQLTLEVERADIQVDSVYGDRIQGDSRWSFFLEEEPRIAYIRISIFGERTVEEFKQALAAVRGQAQAVVLDLRYNPGGILTAATEMCDLLLEQGVIVSTRGRNDAYDSQWQAHAGSELPLGLPMVVLVNGDSASASEIMAGCLQDSHRAKIAGSRSYGKGTVQQVFPLDSEKTALKFTTARFYRPSGANIHRSEEMQAEDVWGVTPEPQLTLELTEVQQLYLNKRWRQRGDPRITQAAEHPPAPEFAGDPQLKLVMDYLRAELNE
ncbi:S41 family peptidase [Aureliella helgolandensis]|uniref:Carboxy-terminal processing protease CtpB n=1 Tax=Aureliella helgolandensis TaxID=2527968 RepID=A0A518G116_9BACT|nr:S41 family peptidase [Aureliella helgolandensis]QDV22293.1 Carboxy-terminal processing protease CtpB precursor [Aureliella helgolandensis]